MANSGSLANNLIPPQPYRYNKSEKINNMKKMKKKWQTSEAHGQLSIPFRFNDNKKIIGTSPINKNSMVLSDDSYDYTKALNQYQEKWNREESKRDFYRNDNEIPEDEGSYDSSESIEEEESEESQEEESEENDADQHQIDILLKDQSNEVEDLASVTVIGNNRRQERVEKTVVQNSQTIWHFYLIY